MNYGFIIDNRRCIGCHACTVACKAEHEVPLGVNRTWVKYVEKGLFPETRRTFTVHRCNHCAEPPCVEICPVTALFLRADGIVDFDSARCIGCKACMQACPYDALYIDPRSHTAAKCNYCAHRVDRGIEPACVIVCPVHAIISGDLDDPASEIARLLARQPVTARKTEKGTRPKLFYTEADETALRPAEAPPGAAYQTTEQAVGVGHHAPSAGAGQVSPSPERWLGAASLSPGGEPRGPGSGVAAAGSAQRIYDAPSKGVLWGWEVAAYLWSKSLAAGALVVPLLLDLAGLAPLDADTAQAMAWLALAFLAVTGLLLVKDLDRPGRFLYVLLRPQWRSWLVRGAYLIAAYGAAAFLYAIAAALEDAPPGAPAMAILIVLGLFVASYTGFLLAQARGRDAWQSRLLPLHMAVQSGVNGAALWLAWGWLAGDAAPAWAAGILAALLLASLGLVLAEFLLPHAGGDAAAAQALMTRGPLALFFWSSIALGGVLPLVLLLWSGGAGAQLPACALVLGFAFLFEHARVRAPQLVPLA